MYPPPLAWVNEPWGYTMSCAGSQFTIAHSIHSCMPAQLQWSLVQLNCTQPCMAQRITTKDCGGQCHTGSIQAFKCPCMFWLRIYV